MMWDANTFLTALALGALLPLNAVAASSSSSSHGAATSTSAAPSWPSAISRAKALVGKMTTAELNNMTYGQTTKTGCSGVSGSVPRLGFPGFCLNDGPAGVRAQELVNAYAAGVSVGASWNPALARARGSYMGAEFKRKGANVALGPVVGPLGRVAAGGRNWEGFAADPYLAGQLAAATIEGLQENVIATVKHFVANEQETHRNPLGDIFAVSSNVSDTDMHEMYLWPFQDAVRAGVASVMCSYNRVNNTYACENDNMMRGLLKDELAFPGFVVSDWGGQHSGLASALAGLDMAMPSSSFWQSGALAALVKNGSLPASRLQDMATRILAAWYYLGQDSKSYPKLGVGMTGNFLKPHTLVDGRDPKAKDTLLQAAIEGHVLVKNKGHALPLRKPKLLSLYGYDAVVPPVNYPTSLSIGLWEYGLEPVNITFTEFEEVLGGNLSFIDRLESATLGNVIVGGGSGASSPSYWSDPYSAMQQRAYQDDTFLLWDFANVDPDVNPASDACLVFINEEASESIDRPALASPSSDELVKNVASKCANTIVVIHNAGIRLVNAWIDNDNVTAVMFGHLPGQDSGRAMVQLLYGEVSPSGRLPYTVSTNAFYYGNLLFPAGLAPGSKSPQANFSNPSPIDYRYFQATSLPVQFPFGYGLTYSNFSYSGLSTKWLTNSAASLPTYPPQPSTKIPGGAASLFAPLATVSMTLKNTGAVTAAEVPQLYVLIPGATSYPGEDKVKVLRGFAKEELAPGKSVKVTWELTRRDLSRWDARAQQWALQKGTYGISVGADVQDTKLKGSLVR